MITRVSARRTTARLGAAFGCVALLSGCGEDLSKDFGFTRSPPDEFTVTTRAPLAMPTDESLPPPEPGAPRPQEQAARTQALETIAPDVAIRGADGTDSPGQEALLASADGNVRQPARGEIRRGEGIGGTLMFWQKSPDLLVDPEAESRRLREAAANGDAPTAGPTRAVAAAR